MRERKIKNNMGYGDTVTDKREKFGKGTIEQRARMAIKDRTTPRDILI